jgi:hypothetical protein
MKKFLMNFEYQGILFSAKVLVKRENRKMFISTEVINNQLTFLLEDGRLMFVQEGEGFVLLLFKKDRTFEILNWEIKLEYMNKTEIAEIDAFSLS